MGELIDSSVLIGLERRGVTPASLARLLAEGEYTLAAITASELLVGVDRAEPPERGLRRSAFVEAVLSRIPVLPFDLRVARTHAGLLADLLARGQRIGAHDLLIAATALVHGHSVLTANLREFQRVPGLELRLPDW